MRKRTSQTGRKKIAADWTSRKPKPSAPSRARSKGGRARSPFPFPEQWEASAKIATNATNKSGANPFRPSRKVSASECPALHGENAASSSEEVGSQRRPRAKRCRPTCWPLAQGAARKPKRSRDPLTLLSSEQNGGERLEEQKNGKRLDERKRDGERQHKTAERGEQPAGCEKVRQLCTRSQEPRGKARGAREADRHAPKKRRARADVVTKLREKRNGFRDVVLLGCCPPPAGPEGPSHPHRATR